MVVKAKGESFPLSSCALSSGDKFVFMCCSFTFVEGLTGQTEAWAAVVSLQLMGGLLGGCEAWRAQLLVGVLWGGGGGGGGGAVWVGVDW